MVCIQLILRFSRLSPPLWFCELRRPSYNHTLHQNVPKHCIYIYYGRVIHSEAVPGLNHVIVEWIAPMYYSDSANSAHLHGFHEVGKQPYDYPLHHKGIKHFIYIQDGRKTHSKVVPGLNHVIVVWFVSS